MLLLFCSTCQESGWSSASIRATGQRRFRCAEVSCTTTLFAERSDQILLPRRSGERLRRALGRADAEARASCRVACGMTDQADHQRRIPVDANATSAA